MKTSSTFSCTLALALFFENPTAVAFPLLPPSTKRTAPKDTRARISPSRPTRRSLQRLFASRQEAKHDAPKQKRKRVDDNDADDDDDDAVDWEALSAELVAEDEDDGLNDGDWLPDREKARQRNAQARRIYAEKVEELQQQTKNDASKTKDNDNADSKRSAASSRPTPYTEEEEDVIAAMGGKTLNPQRRREVGFLGDSTLQEIATDHSVPISYIADVLAMWGVPVPIDVHEQLGSLVTGEQAFALLEAVNSLDVSQLHDRYSNTNILNLCEEWDIDLREAFEMAMKEGWSLPFGVRTCLRIEQEDELLRVLGGQGSLDMSPYYDEDD